MQRQRMKDLLLRALIVVETSKKKIRRRRLADDVKKLHKKRATHAAQLFFPTFIDLWQCHGHCRGHFFNTPYC